MVPVVETERLRLREIRLSDLGPQSEVMRDEAVVRYLGGKPLSREEAWRRLLAARGCWEVFGYGYWAAERKDDGAYVGIVGFGDYKRGLTPSIEGLPEMGWIFAPTAQGQGYAGEAVKAGLEWADSTLGPVEITAIISHGNAPSIRLAERSGFTVREEATYNGEPILLFRRPASPVTTT